MPRKNYRKRLKDILVIILISIALLEITLRFMPGYGISDSVITKFEDTYIHTRRPNSKVLHKVEQRNEVQYNNYGFHDVVYTDVNSPNYSHIGFIGDSFVEGREVKNENTFCTKLRTLFSLKNVPITTYNFGMYNTGTAYQYMLWKSVIKNKIKLDKLYLCVFLGNDIDNNSPYKKSYGKLEWAIDSSGTPFQPSGKLTKTQRLGYFFKEHSAILNSARVFTWNLQNASNRAENVNQNSFHVQTENDKNDSLTCLHTLTLIKKWEEELRNQDTELALLVIKDQYPLVNKEQILLQNLLHEFAERKKIELNEVDFVQPKENHFLWGEQEELGHFNEKGHEKVAQMLFTWNYPFQAKK